MKQFNKTSALRKIKFQQNKNTYIKRLSISLSCLILLFLVILFTFARFENSSDEYTMINGQIKNVCEYELGHEWTYDYTGNEQEFTVPCNGEYKLEVWGAQGGNTTNNGIGGYGAYGVGTSGLQRNEVLYLNVGGQGRMAEVRSKVYYGGYNGGGPCQYLSSNDCINPVGSGGGATHIAKVNGTLLNLQDNVNDILIVSGGGGGANHTSNGGSGGGFKGNDGVGDAGYATGGTQTAGGIDRNGWNAMFGGGSGAKYAVGSIADGTFFGGAGGGGGYYGGARGFYNASTSAGGGSGYIGNSNLTNKKMVCYNCATSNDTNTKTISNTCHNANPTSDCAKEGNGFAKLTLVSTTDYVKVSCDNLIGKTWTFDYTGNSQEFSVPCNGQYKLEAWGAQGAVGQGESQYISKGAYGGYSVGVTEQQKDSKLYVVVGGQGATSKSQVNYVGGYNGGNYSAGSQWGAAGSGGATHIATVSGLLTQLEEYKGTLNSSGKYYESEKILIVSGGGGVFCTYKQRDSSIDCSTANGGSNGGGFQGMGGNLGGTQIAGGKATTNAGEDDPDGYGIFGRGTGNHAQGHSASAGGGGFFGGASVNNQANACGGGGSGYIASTNLISNGSITKHMYCYNCTTSNETNIKTTTGTCTNTSPIVDCAKQGNGYARITYISNN